MWVSIQEVESEVNNCGIESFVYGGIKQDETFKDC